MNSLLKPSGPGALSFGKDLTIKSISCLMKGVSRQSKSGVLSMKKLRLKVIAENSDCPNLSLKASHRIFSFSTWLRTTSPLLFCN